MALTQSAARARVQSLYGTTVVGHLYGADRLQIARFHSDPNAHVRFQPDDESLPRFRIPVSEFPEVNWLHKKMKGKWVSEVTVEPHDWPPEKKLPSAKFNPPLATQFRISKNYEEVKDREVSDGASLHPESPNVILEPSLNAQSLKSGKKKMKQTKPNQLGSMQSQSGHPDIVKGRGRQKYVIKQADTNLHSEDNGIDAMTLQDSRSDQNSGKFIKRSGKATSSAQNDNLDEKYRSPSPTLSLSANTNSRLVLRHQYYPDNSSIGRPRRPNNALISTHESEPDDGLIKLISSEDESRRLRSGRDRFVKPLIPRGNYVCHRCNVPGHFIADCPLATPKVPKLHNDRQEAVSQSSIRFRRRRPLEEAESSATDTPIRPFRSRHRHLEADGSETDVTFERQKPTKQSKPKKAFYKDYISEKEVAVGLAENTLVEGVLHVSAKRSTEAYVRRSESGGGRDIRIVGHRNRNRAYDGDTVVVRILPTEECSEDEAKESSAAEDTELVLLPEEDVPNISSDPAALDGLTAKLDAVILSDAVEAEEEDQPRQLGEIVAIKTRAKDVTVDIIGYLKLLISKDKSNSEAVDNDDGTIQTSRLSIPVSAVSPEPTSVIMFQPVSKRIPRGFVSNSLWPADLKSSDSELVKIAWNSIYSASYRPWKVHQKSPRVGKLELIGSAGHVESETAALLRASKISHSEDFAPEVLESLTEFGYGSNAESGSMWSIPKEVLSERRDYRNARVFTIDPSTAKDLDDALSITKISDDIFEIGVHIADVSFFVKEDSPLDLEARKRCTSVYLVQKVIPMLPPLLCEELCSLNPGVDRLCFSVVWRMSRNGRICPDFDPWFGRTVIRSCSKLDYRTAQRIVDGETDIRIDLFGNHTFQEIADDCRQMMEIAMARRRHRFEVGSLKLDRPKMHFEFDEDFNPVSVAAYELHDSNRMIEEYMLLANLLVAEKLAKDIPDVALLRRHIPPAVGKLAEVIEVCSKLGYKIDGQSSQTLHRTLMQIEEEDVRGFISVMLTVAMKRAEYLCINGISSNRDEVLEEKGFAHYALGFEAYTHFTSPIRRYADVIVHRMLQHCLARESDPTKIKKLPDPEEVSKMATRCNEMKNRAKDAQDMSLLMYLAVLVKKKSLTETAYVMDLGVKAFCVYVPRLGLEDRIMIDKIPNIKSAVIKRNSDSDLKILHLEWEDGHIERRGMFEPLRVQVGVSSTVPYTVQLTVLPTLSAE